MVAPERRCSTQLRKSESWDAAIWVSGMLRLVWRPWRFLVQDARFFCQILNQICMCRLDTLTGGVSESERSRSLAYASSDIVCRNSEVDVDCEF